MADIEVPVLIVGGGPVGLCASLLLSRFGVTSLLIERHPSTSVHPRARGLNVRTMELLRTWDLEHEVREAGRALEKATEVVWAESLAGRELRRVTAGGRREDLRPVSPTTGCACAQDALEPVLLARARGYGVGSIAFEHGLTGFETGHAEVTATVRQNSTGREMTARAGYLVAADGADSGARQALRVGVSGLLNRQIGIYFEAPLGHLVAERPAALYFIENAAISGLFAAVDNADRWVFYTARPPDWDPAAGGLPAGRCVELVRQAANPVTDYLPAARPGSRAPHAWLQRIGERISTIDLFDAAFTLLAGASGQRWRDAAVIASRDLGLPLAAYMVGRGGDLGDEQGTWAQLYGIAPDGAVLVRPDGHVAWRSAAAVTDPQAELVRALHAVLGLART